MRGRTTTAAATLLLVSVAQIATSLAFLHVGRRLARGHPAGHERGAATAFQAWWMGIGAYLAIEGALTLLAAGDSLPLAALLAGRYVGFVLVGAGFWGLTYYVLFLWTGRTGARVPLAIVFGALALGLAAFAASHGPRAVDARAWSVMIAFDAPIRGLLYSLILAGFALPPIAACVGYLSLWTKVSTRVQRYRIALVSASIILYLGSGLLARLGTSDVLQFANLALGGPATALAALWAFRPPRAVRSWLGLPDRADDRERPDPRAKRQALLARCRDLI